MNGLFEILASFTFPVLMDSKKLGRIGTQGYFLILGGVCCLISTILLEQATCESPDLTGEQNQVIVTQIKMESGIIIARILAYIGKFCFAGAFILIFAYTAEFYPAEVRSAGFAVGSFAARISGVSCPFIIALGEIRTWLPGMCFSFFGISAGLLTFLLPETRGRALVSSMKETIDMYKLNKK